MTKEGRLIMGITKTTCFISMYVAADIYVNELPVVIACKHVEDLFYWKRDANSGCIVFNMHFPYRFFYIRNECKY
jgi:hypothetical protein